MTKSEEKLYLYVKSPLDDGTRKFSLIEIEGEERISSPFFYKVKLKSEDKNIDFSKMIGKALTIIIESFTGEKRYINGIITRFLQAETGRRFTTYYAEIRPWLWQLTLTSNNRIYQSKTVIDIISSVFKDLGFTDFNDRTSKRYAQREYCVQYQESAFDFVSRLMEEEGIFYFFEHNEDSHILIMGDDSDAHPAIPGSSTIKMREAEQKHPEVIDSCTYEENVIPEAYSTKDFNFETPDVDLMVKVKGSGEGKLEIFEYPGGFKKTTEGEDIANRRLEVYELPQKILRGEGSVRTFIAGYKFKLSGHERGDLNREYIIQSLSIMADQKSYTNSFEAIPSNTPFRPPRTTDKPIVAGTETAIVVGKKDEEIWTDKYGRVKVQFHWDRDGKKNENSSCWVRVAQVWAGKGWGSLFIPRVGTEVIVSFINGDPDRPLIIGTLYNANHVPPYTLPQNQNRSTIKTISTKKGKAGNEIRFDDTKDAEEIFIHAQKDMNISVENDLKQEILNNETDIIKKDCTVKIQEGNHFLTIEKGDRKIEVKKGNETYQIKGKRTISVDGKETHKNTDDYIQEVKGNYTLNIKGNLTINVKGSITIKANGSLKNEAGRSLINKAGTSITNKAKTSITNKAGTSITNKADMSITNKAKTNQTVDGGGMLTLKGGLVKIN